MFDGVEDIVLKPKVILASSILHMINSDGVVAEEEINYLYTVLKDIGDAEHLIELATKYNVQNDFDEFLGSIDDKLNETQKDILMINLVDIMCLDGHADEQEMELLYKFSNALNQDPHKIQGYIDVFKKRHNIKVFEN
jgi:uncharacterized tellurite resistance protein B-like protein